MTGDVGLSYEAFGLVTFDGRYHDSTLNAGDCAPYTGFRGASGARVVGAVELGLDLSRVPAR